MCRNCRAAVLKVVTGTPNVCEMAPKGDLGRLLGSLREVKFAIAAPLLEPYYLLCFYYIMNVRGEHFYDLWRPNSTFDASTSKHCEHVLPKRAQKLQK